MLRNAHLHERSHWIWKFKVLVQYSRAFTYYIYTCNNIRYHTIFNCIVSNTWRPLQKEVLALRHALRSYIKRIKEQRKSFQELASVLARFYKRSHCGRSTEFEICMQVGPLLQGIHILHPRWCTAWKIIYKSLIFNKQMLECGCGIYV